MTIWARIKVEWWFRVSRKWDRDYLCREIAFRLPRRVVYWAFIRVFANTEPYDHLDAFQAISERWEAGPRG